MIVIKYGDSMKNRCALSLVCMISYMQASEDAKNSLHRTLSDTLGRTLHNVRNLETGELEIFFSEKRLEVLQQEEADRLGLQSQEAAYVRTLYDCGCTPNDVFYAQEIYNLEISGISRSKAIEIIRVQRNFR